MSIGSTVLEDGTRRIVDVPEPGHMGLFGTPPNAGHVAADLGLSRIGE